MRRLAVAMLTALVVCDAARADQSPHSGIEIVGGVEIRWIVKTGPGLVIVARNLEDSFARVVTLWNPRVCDGVAYKYVWQEIPGLESSMHQGLDDMALAGTDDWDLIAYPLDLEFQSVPPRSDVLCETQVRVSVHRPGKEAAVYGISAPAPLPELRADGE